MGHKQSPVRPVTDAQREEMDKYIGLVVSVAQGFKKRLPQMVELHDLIGYGTFGLAKAIRRFDPNKGVMFKTFAQRHIAGAIIDGLRGEDWVPRLVRIRKEEVVQVKSMNVDIKTKEYKTDFNKGVAEVHQMADRKSPNPFARAAENDAIQQFLVRFQPRLRSVVRLYFIDNLTMKEIGSSIGVGESRVCQLIGQAVRVMKSWRDNGTLPEFLDEIKPKGPIPPEKQYRYHGRTPSVFLGCRQYPGQRFSLREAAELAGVTKPAVNCALRQNRAVGKKGLEFWLAPKMPADEKAMAA